MDKVINQEGIELKVGDKIKIISDNLGDRSLVMVNKDDIITITGFSDNGRILYYHNSLALPVNSNIYVKYVQETQ